MREGSAIGPGAAVEPRTTSSGSNMNSPRAGVAPLISSSRSARRRPPALYRLADRCERRVGVGDQGRVVETDDRQSSGTGSAFASGADRAHAIRSRRR